MIIVVCSAVIRKDDSFLMVKEFKPHITGKWGLPGGKLEEGESTVDAVRREVREEVGHDVTSEKLLCIVNKPVSREGNTVIRFIFQCGVSDQPTSSAEHQYEFLTMDQLTDLENKGLIRGQEVVPLLQKIHSGLAINANDFLQIL